MFRHLYRFMAISLLLFSASSCLFDSGQKNIVVYHDWKGNAVETYTFTFGTPVPEASEKYPAPNGFWGGWTYYDHTGGEIPPSDGDSTPIGYGDVNAYPDKGITVTYDLNGLVIAEYSLSAGEAVTEPTKESHPDAPWPDPFYFWTYYDEESNPVEYSPGDETSESIVAYPYYPTKYGEIVFIYIFEGGFESLGNDYNYYIVEFSPIEFPSPEEVKDYTFSGWYYDEDLTRKVEGEVLYDPETTTVFYGLYTADFEYHEVTFEYEDGTEAAKYVKDGETITFPEEPESDSSKSFAGWYDASGRRYYKETVVTEDTHLEARFVEPKIIDGYITPAKSIFLLNDGRMFCNGEEGENEFFSEDGITAFAYYNGTNWLFRSDGYYVHDKDLTKTNSLGHVIDADSAIGSNSNFLVVLNDEGKAYINGNFRGTAYSFEAIDIDDKIVKIDAAWDTIAALTESGDLYLWGKTFKRGAQGESSSVSEFPKKVAGGVSDFDIGNHAVAYIDGNDALWFRGVMGLYDHSTTYFDFEKLKDGVSSVYVCEDENDANINYILVSTNAGDIMIQGYENFLQDGYGRYDSLTKLYEGFDCIEEFQETPAFLRGNDLYLLHPPLDYEMTEEEPYLVFPDKTITAVASNGSTNLALAENGDLYYFGKDIFHTDTEIMPSPALLISNVKIVTEHFIITNDDRIHAYGYTERMPEHIATKGDIKSIKGPYILFGDHTLYSYEDGNWKQVITSVKDFFINDMEQLVAYTDNDTGVYWSTGTQNSGSFQETGMMDVVEAYADGYIDLVLLSNGELWWKGSNRSDYSLSPAVNDGSYSKEFERLGKDMTFKQMVAIDNHFLFINKYGRIVALGAGQSYNNSIGFNGAEVSDYGFWHLERLTDTVFTEIIPRTQAKNVIALTSNDIYEVENNSQLQPRNHGRTYTSATNRSSTLALTEDGKLYSWGSNRDGTIGNGMSGYTYVPLLMDISLVYDR